MQKNKPRKPTRSRFSLLRQLCNLIPNHLVPGLARQYNAEAKSRTFKPWSHVVSRMIHVVDSTPIQLVARCNRNRP